ncbi:MAG TPA: porin [Thermoanaerobaculia bacterium]|nr:porin [Thermoanaerobaculia bacterium]
MLNKILVCAGLAGCLAILPAAAQEPDQASASEQPVNAPAPEKKDESAGKLSYNKGFSFVSADRQFTMKITSRLQSRYTLTDPEVGDSVGSFRIRRAKTSFEGMAFGDWKYKVQVNWVGGTVVNAVSQTSSGAVSSSRSNGPVLEDAQIEYMRNPLAVPWIGQGKAFFGRQELTSSGRQQFVDRSIASGRFAAGRDQGIGLTGTTEAKTFEYNLGVYNGNGINQSTNDNKDYLTVARLVWTPFGEYKLEESSLDYPASPRLALGASGYQNTVGTGTGERDLTRLNGEFAFKVNGLNMVGEYYTEESQPPSGPSLDTDGFYYQLGYLFPNRIFEIAGRYAVISPDTAVDSDQIETRLGLNAYFSKSHEYKLQADYGQIEDELRNTKDKEARLQLQLWF